MSRYRSAHHPHEHRVISTHERWKALYHEHGEPAPWERARRDRRDVTTRPVSEWTQYDQRRYAEGWRPDRFGDDPSIVPEDEH